MKKTIATTTAMTQPRMRMETTFFDISRTTTTVTTSAAITTITAVGHTARITAWSSICMRYTRFPHVTLRITTGRHKKEHDEASNDHERHAHPSNNTPALAISFLDSDHT